jgi:hypothetical protein
LEERCYGRDWQNAIFRDYERAQPARAIPKQQEPQDTKITKNQAAKSTVEIRRLEKD